VIDCVYVAASRHDARLTRDNIASIRCIYPSVPIKLLVGGALQSGLVGDLRRYWDVAEAALPAGDYGWGFVKLEPLFGRAGERFVMLDSDTVLTGPVFDRWNTEAPFLVAEEQFDDAAFAAHFYDWRGLRALDDAAAPPQFGFNSGHWLGTAGVLARDDFSRWIEWGMPRQLRYPKLFYPGDQGVFNYVINRAVAVDALPVERRPDFLWPGLGLNGLTAAGIEARTAPPLIVHWAGMKKVRFRDMVGEDILRYFEAMYYERLPAGRRALDLGRDRCVQTATSWARRLSAAKGK
jgi:hypothetical protein